MDSKFTYYFKNKAKLVFEDYVSFYLKIQKIRYRNKAFKHQIVGRETDIVIDGFPRSANSFATYSFIKAQYSPNIIVGHHTHSYAQIIRACQLEKPTILVIRNPYSAITSLKALYLELYDGDFEILKRWPPCLDIKYYTRFYRRVFRYRHHLIIAPFEKTTTDYTEVLRRLNTKFNCRFSLFKHTEKNQKEIFNNHGYHLSPSVRRDQFKGEVERYLKYPKNEKLLLEAQEVYNKWISYYCMLYPQDKQLFDN